MKRMFVIYGEQNSGKTHTMWLLLCHLIEQGAKVELPMFHVNQPYSYDEVMATKEQLPDFRAVVEWYGKKVMLLSAGDYLEHYYWGFRQHMQWASEKQIDYIICCARSRNIEGSVYRELMEVYRNQTLTDEDWFLTERMNNNEDWLQDRDQLAKKIIISLKNAIMKDMPIHYRTIFPVGQGGLTVERIENMTIIFDCGSLSSPARVEMYIDELKRRQILQIEYIFISHFDQDHVNGIDYLLSSGIGVRKAVISYIPHDLQVVYNFVTRGAYENMLSVLRRNECQIEEITNEGENSGRAYKHKDLWEWVAHSQMTTQDFANLRQTFINKGINLNRLDDIGYLEQNKEDINNIFKETFGQQGPNSKGLIVLSQKTPNAQLFDADLENGICCCGLQTSFRNLSMTPDRTSCLYVGDARIKASVEVNEIMLFLRRYMHEDHLLLMQLPHHGSNNNIAKDLHMSINADAYFVNDKSEKRIQKSATLYQELSKQDRLFVVKDMCPDLILGTTKLQ